MNCIVKYDAIILKHVIESSLFVSKNILENEETYFSNNASDQMVYVNMK